MTIKISDTNAEYISVIATYLETKDGNPRSTDDIVEWLIGAVSSIRPDIATALVMSAPKGDN
jgi:hypothetical protein